eukprot:s52_g39.t1
MSCHELHGCICHVMRRRLFVVKPCWWKPWEEPKPAEKTSRLAFDNQRTLPAQSSPVSPTAFGSPQVQGPLPQPQQTTQQVTLVDPGVALNVIQAQSQQIAELVQLAKGLGELQAAAAVQKAASPIAAGSGDAPGASGSDEAAPMNVDKDTGGVRHYKAESYLPKIPMLNFEKMVTRASEISHWSEFVEGVTSWLALLGDFYPIELYRATITETVVRQDTLEKGPAARSARFHNLLKQSLGTFQRGLDIVRQAEQQQLGAACGYTSFRRLNPEFGIQSRMEATSIREALAYRPGKHLQRPLDIYRAVEAELLKADRNLHSYPSVNLSEAEKVMLHFKCMPESCKHYVLLHAKSDTLEQVLDSIKFYDSHLRLAVWTEELIAAFTRGQGKTKGKEKGKDKGKSSGKTQQDGKGKNGKGKGDGKSEGEVWGTSCGDGSMTTRTKQKNHVFQYLLLLAILMGMVVFQNSKVLNSNLSLVVMQNSKVLNSNLSLVAFQNSKVEQQPQLGEQGDDTSLDSGWQLVGHQHGHDVFAAQEYGHGRMVGFQHGHVRFSEPDSEHEQQAQEHGHVFPQHVVEQVSLLGSASFDLSDQRAWLVDSGASSHLIGETLLEGGHVRILEESRVNVQCSLASGDPMTLTRKVKLLVMFVTSDCSVAHACLTSLVCNSASHAILSTGALARKGWQVSINSDGVTVQQGSLSLGVTLFGNVG